MQRRAAAVLAILSFMGAAPPTGTAPADTFVTLDAQTKYFRSVEGLFCGFGVNYCQRLDGKMCHAPSLFDLEVMADDLKQIKRLGFTHVVLRMNWGLLGRKETKAQGLRQWDVLLDLVKAHGLYAEIWFDPMNSWPHEVQSKHRYQTIFRDASWGLYLDWVAEMVGRFKDRTCILAWRSENESLPIGTAARHANEPALRQRYVKALRAHYKTIDRVNAAWGTTHKSFDEVTTPGKEHDLPDSAQLIDFNVLFREPFIIERNEQLARVIREHDPNHLLVISGIGACGGRAGGLFEVHDVDKLAGFDICGNGLYGQFEPQGSGSLLHYARTVRKFLSLGRPAMITEVGPGQFKLGDGFTRDWILHHFADAVGAGATAMDIWAYTTITDARGNFRSTHTATCHALGEFIQGVKGAVFEQERPRVLIVKTKAEDYGRWPWRCAGNAMMVGDFLYQLHVPYDVMTDANVTPERLKRYAFVFVPSQSVLIEEPMWQMLGAWLRAKADRGLAVGAFSPRSASFKPVTPVTMAKLMGFDPGVSYSVIPLSKMETLAFRFEHPFGSFRPGDTLPVRYGGGDVLWDMRRPWHDSARIVATLEGAGADGAPLVVRNTLPNGAKVYSLAMRLGLVSWSPGVHMRQPTFDNMACLYNEMLKAAGVTGRYDAPRNVGVYMSKANDVVIVKERLGIPTTRLLRSERLGRSLYLGATVTRREDRAPTLSAPLRPRAVKVFRRVPIEICRFDGEVSVTVTDHGPRSAEMIVTGKDVTLAIGGLAPKAKVQLTSIESASGRQRADVLTSDGAGTVQVRVQPSGQVAVRLVIKNR